MCLFVTIMLISGLLERMEGRKKGMEFSRVRVVLEGRKYRGVKGKGHKRKSLKWKVAKEGRNYDKRERK